MLVVLVPVCTQGDILVECIIPHDSESRAYRLLGLSFGAFGVPFQHVGRADVAWGKTQLLRVFLQDVAGCFVPSHGRKWYKITRFMVENVEEQGARTLDHHVRVSVQSRDFRGGMIC